MYLALVLDLRNLAGCTNFEKDFKIILHTPAEIPQLSQNFFTVSTNQNVLISMRPDMIVTSEGLRNNEPNRLAFLILFSRMRALKNLINLKTCS